MGATIPKSVATTPFHEVLCSIGLERMHQGKVRDTYALSDDHLLVVATDRISICDFVLPALVEQKGELLTAMTIFWLTEVLKDVDHHLVAYGKGIDQYLSPSITDLPGRIIQDIRRRAIVVRKLKMLPIEFIVRGYLTGSGWKSYQKNRQVCGIKLPDGLHDGSQIVPNPIFTPTTKAKVGHDEHLPTNEVLEQYGSWPGEKSLVIYKRLADFTTSKGFLLADTKFEFGEGGVLADEVGTPDSSRFWRMEDWQQASDQRKSPAPFDKEIVRTWGSKVVTPFLNEEGNDIVGLGNLDPENLDHLDFVGGLEVPQSILSATRYTYTTAFECLTDGSLRDYQENKIDTAP